jgi:hypothetical protein
MNRSMRTPALVTQGLLAALLSFHFILNALTGRIDPIIGGLLLVSVASVAGLVRGRQWALLLGVLPTLALTWGSALLLSYALTSSAPVGNAAVAGVELLLEVGYLAVTAAALVRRPSVNPA